MIKVKRLNCVGDICPVPVIKTKKAFAEINTDDAAFEGIEILIDNEIAVQNISKLLNSMGCSFSTLKEETGHFLVSVSEFSGVAAPSLNQDRPQQGAGNKSGIAVISSEFMGSGDDILGKILIKGFIFALTQLETLPMAVIFYNGGVHHTLKNSACIKDLQYLQEQRVQILVCGTCLNHFNALSNLAVGEVTDMYNIVNLMQQAACIIKP